ncbi:hypothetical protein PRIPAC_91824 [Pristionchus pacificus]|uniref:Uncharacterized protein n=1 Tax=Pristionchus pacificus TaxID=54126 RepID=A0A2A6BPW7_PRIPA|nr:hypothetical protein PRIPAC_91824 [Pristionchus pacificus]|eukprot:PDM67992.1 hypothetical protein PRIPAC_46036 [Pristionchus pacificus]
MRVILFSLLFIALIFCHVVNAEIDTRWIEDHPKDVKRAIESSEGAERPKRFQTCDGEGFWEKVGYIFLSLFVKLNC